MQIRKKKAVGTASLLPLLLLALASGFVGGYMKGHHDGSSKQIVEYARRRTLEGLQEKESPDAVKNTSSKLRGDECKCNSRISEALSQKKKLEKEVTKLQETIKELEKKVSKEEKREEASLSSGSIPIPRHPIDPMERSFLEVGKKSQTDKVAGHSFLKSCLGDPNKCTRKNCEREACRPWGHFYDTLYQKTLGHLSRDDTEPFQFLEIGFFTGRGFDAYRAFFPNAEAHSIEISCLPHGDPEEGKWPFDNFAKAHKNFTGLVGAERLHCGDANKVDFLNHIWINKMKRPDAPPLRVVVDDGAHVAEHMAQTVFFWFPRIEPGGFLVIEDIQPIPEANAFRTEFIPQIMADIHYCGDPVVPDKPCFPTILPILQSVHCEMHICILERNHEPAQDLSLELSTMPADALNHTSCRSFQG